MFVVVWCLALWFVFSVMWLLMTSAISCPLWSSVYKCHTVGELGFLNCDDVCMCVMNKRFELLEFVSESVYVDLQYD